MRLVDSGHRHRRLPSGCSPWQKQMDWVQPLPPVSKAGGARLQGAALSGSRGQTAQWELARSARVLPHPSSALLSACAKTLPHPGQRHAQSTSSPEAPQSHTAHITTGQIKKATPLKALAGFSECSLRSELKLSTFKHCDTPTYQSLKTAAFTKWIPLKF